MQADSLSSLTIAQYELHLRAAEETWLPPFLGSTLRGAFGHALKQAVCIMDHRHCETCLVAERCIYPYLFETPVPPNIPQLRGQQNAPHPFILIPPLLDLPEEAGCHSTLPPREQRRHLSMGEEITFGLRLIGRAIEYLPYVIFAVSEMGRRGLSAGRARFDLRTVDVIDAEGHAETIYHGARQRLAIPHGTTGSLEMFIRPRLAPISAIDSLKLRFLTPTRIRVEGDLQMGLSFELLVRNLLRRVSTLMAVHGQAPLDVDYRTLIAQAATVETNSAVLRWWDWERYSNRQQTKMKLGGFVGEIEFTGEALREFLPLVLAGEILHVGAGTSFGLGRYRVLPC